MGVESHPSWSAAFISSNARSFFFGFKAKNRSVAPKPVPVVSAPAWMRSVAWDLF